MVEDDSINQVMQFRSLGIDTSSSYDPVKDLRSQINKASALSGCLQDSKIKYIRLSSDRSRRTAKKFVNAKSIGIIELLIKQN